MAEQPQRGEYQPRPLITKIDRDNCFFKAYDNLNAEVREPGKPPRRYIMFEIFKHEPKPWVSTHFSVDPYTIIALLRAVNAQGIGNHTDKTGYRDYKGGPHRAYDTGFESRVLEIEYVPSLRNKDEYGYNWKITNGPGQETSRGTGAVSPAKSSNDRPKVLTFFMSEPEMYRLLTECEMWINAFMAANFTALRDVHTQWGRSKKQSEDAGDEPARRPTFE